MSRPVSALVAVVTLAVVVTACSESSMGPAHELTRGPSLPTVATPVQLTEATLESSASEYRFSFIVSPAGTIYGDGVNTIQFPADAICEPASGYGPAYWNSACLPVKKDVQFTVTLTQAGGVRKVTFSPDVRFVPGKEIVLRTDASSLAVGAPVPTIFWTPDGSQLVNESTADASLSTKLDSTNKTLVRRIKHFSGYTVDLGFKKTCETDPTLPECTNGGA